MPRSYIKTGPKPSHLFALTLNKVEWPKSLTGFWFTQDGGVKSMVVGEEDYHVPLDCDTGKVSDGDNGRHHHCFIEMVEGYLLDDMRTMVDTLVDGKGYDLQVCKSRKSWIIYCTKGDGHPFLYNVGISECSLYARSNNHIKNKYKRPMPIDTADDFMFAAGNFRNVVIEMANNHCKRLRNDLQNDRAVMDPNMLCGYSRKIYNSFINGKHLFIYGQPGVGKTELIDSLVKPKKTWRAGAVDRFMFGTLTEYDEVALFEDFDLNNFSQLAVLLSVMDGKPVAICQKFKDDEIRMFSAKCIFISNYMLSDASPLYRRVTYVCVSHKIYECEKCVQ